MYAIKVSNTVDLRDMYNIPEGVISINFTNGIIRVQDFKSALDIAGIIDIEKFKTETINPHVSAKKPEVGSIVRIMDKGQCVHVVIIEVDNNDYTAAKMKLYIADKGVILEKNKDVIYKNHTYKDYTTVLFETYNNLKLEDFLDYSNPVVGEITNFDLLNQVIAKVKNKFILEKDINWELGLESLISQLNLDVSTSMLAKAMVLAKKMSTSNIRKLTIEIKKIYNISQSNSDIQAKIDSEYMMKISTEWITELDRSGFLKKIVKTF